MITVQCAQSTIVSNSVAGEMALTAPGEYQFGELLWIRGYTNVPIVVSPRDGAVFVVDAFGKVGWTEGPSFDSVAVAGFVFAFGTVGLVLFGRWIYRLWGRALGAQVE